MKSEDIFALVVRIAGLVSLLYLLFFATISFSMLGRITMSLPMILRLVAWALVSLWLLRGAPQLVRFAYGRE